MKVNVVMPKMGESINEGTIIKWHKKPGDHVKKDEIIYEISTDKVDTEIPSPADGVLLEVKVFEQETVPVDTVVAVIETSASAAVPPEKEQPRQEVPKQEQPKIETPQPKIPEPEVMERAKDENIRQTGSSRFFSPLVMNIAEKENISSSELEKIPGTGADGRITKNDLLSYIDKNRTPKPVRTLDSEKEMEFSGQDTSKQYGVHQEIAPGFQQPEKQNIQDEKQLIPMDNIRQKIMKHMVTSRDTSVHVSAVIEADVTNIQNFIKNNKEHYLKRENIKLTYMPFIAYACIKALKQYPYVNASIDGTNIVLKNYVNLGFAVAVEPNGLIVPNIKNADQKNIKGLAKEIAILSEKSRTRKLVPDDISGGTFTITNYGVFGTLFGTPIINQPEVAILGVGSVTKKPVVMEIDGSDVIAVRAMLYLSLSHDHRLVDGMLGGRFLSDLKNTLENFDWEVIF